jgi:hypothetical protein
MHFDEEQAALDMLIGHLQSRGDDVTVLRRPDREETNARAVDFELRCNEKVVGVEVTSASNLTYQYEATKRFNSALQSELRPIVEAEGLGNVLLRGRYERPPTKGECRRLPRRIVADIASAIRSADIGPAWNVVPAPSPLRRVEVSVLAATPNVVRLLPFPTAYFVEGSLYEFIDDLVAKKAGQGSTYAELWILFFARTPMDFDADDVAAAFQHKRAALPSNWTRIFFLSPNGVTEV